MRLLTIVLTSAALVLAGCGDDEPVAANGSSTTSPSSTPTGITADQAELDAAQDRWREAGIDDYELEWSVQCFCPLTSYVDTIEDGEVVDHRPAPENDGVEDPGPKTMEDIFGEVQAAIDSEPDSLSVEYDPDTGAVDGYFVDPDERAADEEYGLSVEVRADPDSGTTNGAGVTAADLTDDHACGYGFQAGRPDQTAGLFLSRGEPATSGTVTLPADEWTVEVRIGEDLFANWCDDVMEPDEPEPSTAETWTVVAGTLDVTVPDQIQAEATVTATGLVAERPDGSRVELGDITITNEFYGTIPG
ncbi:MAG: DUF6174 domain-containing protein [Acidimicrobiales bacterium]|nr:DUF6174 domain-containing protein [Acidimicrobiales bacterium]